MTTEQPVRASLTAEQATAVNEIRSAYYDRFEGSHWEAMHKIRHATGLPVAAADWLLFYGDNVTAGPLPEEAFR